MLLNAYEKAYLFTVVIQPESEPRNNRDNCDGLAETPIAQDCFPIQESGQNGENDVLFVYIIDTLMWNGERVVHAELIYKAIGFVPC